MPTINFMLFFLKEYKRDPYLGGVNYKFHVNKNNWVYFVKQPGFTTCNLEPHCLNYNTILPLKELTQSYVSKLI